MNWLTPLRLLGITPRKPLRKRRRPVKALPALETLEIRTVPSSTVMTNLPAAANDWTDTDGSTPVTVQVLANDTASAGATLRPASIRVLHEPAHGTVTVDRVAGEITYRAATNFAGTDTFRYIVRDTSGAASNPAKVSVRINRPVASDDWTDTDGTTPVTVSVLANDTDPDGNEHIDPTKGTGASVSLARPPQNGSVIMNSDGTFTYQANPGFVGTDSFRYTVTDDNGGTSLPATAYVRVNAPTANDDLASFTSSSPITIPVIANDTDPDGNEHIDPTKGTGAFTTLVSGAAHGSVTANSDGTFTYQANPGFTGTDTFRYTVTDDAGATSQPATVTVVGVQAVGANDDFTDTDGSTPVKVDVLANDNAPGTGHLLANTVRVTERAQHGRLVVHPDGSITFIGKAGFTGTDTFQYSVAATDPGSSPSLVVLHATVSVRVNRPVAADDWIDTDGTSPVTVDVLANDQDPDGNDHINPALHTGAAVTLLGHAQHGRVTLNADGSFTYTARAGFVGTDSFRYTVTDDAGATSKPATALVRVNAPTAGDDFAQATGTQPLTINVLENDQDPDGNGHLVATSVTIVKAPEHGQATVNASGQIVYTANPGWGGTDTLRYTVSDDAGATSQPGTVVVFTAVPVARNGKATLVGTRNTTFDVMRVASDPAGSSALDHAVVTITAQPQHGHATVDATTNAIHFTGDSGFFGREQIRYTITDDSGAVSHVATLTVDVLPTGA
jgi:hypothetical protein